MLKYVVMTYRLHICDMFDKMPFMASRGPVKSFHLYHCFNVTFHFQKFQEVLGSGFNPGPEKWDYGVVGSDLAEKTPVARMPLL